MKPNVIIPTKPRFLDLGFTLIEVMVVIVLIGIMASMVQFTFSGKRPEDVIQEESNRFVAIFESAADYGLLNNVELGVYIKDNSYQFLGYDGVKWSSIPGQDWLSTIELPENVEITLKLDDLPIEEPPLVDAKLFTEQANEYLSFDDIEAKKEKQTIPQIYLLSGGDITAFSLTFHFSEEAMLYNDELTDIAYRVTGVYAIPLTIEGPILDDK